MKRLTLLAAALLALPVTAAEVQEIKVVNDQAPDCSSLDSIIKTVTKNCKTDDAKAIAIFNFLRYVNYHLQYPQEKGGIATLKLINVYGWSLCGGQHAALSALWEKAGFKWRFMGWNGHTTVEAGYGVGWHFLDSFMNFWVWKKDDKAPGGYTVAGQEDIAANPSLVNDGFVMDAERGVQYHKGDRYELVDGKANIAPSFQCCGDDLKWIPGECKTAKRSGSPRGWMGIKFDDEGYSTAVNLGPGFSLTLDWAKADGAFFFSNQTKKIPRHSCSDKEYRNDPIIGPLLEPYRKPDPVRGWSNGTLRFKPALADAACLEGFSEKTNVVCKDGALKPEKDGEPAVVVVHFASPYPMTKASAAATFAEADTGAAYEVLSADGKWAAVNAADFGQAVYGRYAADFRLTFTKPLTALDIPIVVQHNQEALPYLAPGKNTITISVKDPAALGKNKLVITYAYCTGSRYRSPEKMLEKPYEIAKGHAASWNEAPVVVQKVVDSFPCTLEIPIATPKGKFPVYPKMLFLRREVLAPGAQPLETPAAPSEPKVGAEEELLTLPWPFTIGSEPPKAQ